MSEKTPFELLLTFVSKQDVCNECPLYENGDCNHKEKNNCYKNLKQYFREQAKLPDGWDVLKVIKQEMDSFKNAAPGVESQLRYQSIANLVNSYFDRYQSLEPLSPFEVRIEDEKVKFVLK